MSFLGTIFSDLGPAAIVQRLAPVNLPVAPVLDVIRQTEHVALVKTKPMSRSVEGWTSVVGAGTIIVNALGPAIGLQVNGQLAGAVETVFVSALGFPVGYGTALVYAVPGVSCDVAW